MFVVRQARRSDLAPLDALFARAYPRLLRADYPPSVLVTAIPLIARAQPALLASGSYYVAEEAGRLLGAGGWTARGPGAGGTAPGVAHVRHMVTDDRELRRGIGRAILETAFDAARATGVTGLHCHSTRTAEAFYAAMGFARIGPAMVPLAPGIAFPAIEMWRPL
ncbi:GNAT family N-acetyltransferase [Roseisalinus antarcticus]|uniref:Acetyltransferase (GNAT) family protein n=1 Tax=Roseisalinus antarcticus TaxID=254357 RepID=A0A1Y5SVM9_9RHOB|nr:GNAT family N-acetyltransferase [Roseisalinus antarcticus]SLN46218.1 Acetyltransferase (GNAT) family protein [Roseisalinus antarcticus]